MNKTDLKVGDKVDYHSVIGGDITSKGHEILHIEHRYLGRKFDGIIAFISDKRGFVAIEALTLTKVGAIDGRKTACGIGK